MTCGPGAKEPTVDIDGPYVPIAKAQKDVDECGDKKALKELEDALAALKESFTFMFDRQLINKTESKTFTITNTCKPLRVNWIWATSRNRLVSI